MEYSLNISSLQPSATVAVSTLAKSLQAEGRDVIDLSAGEPDFDTPEWISDAAVNGIRAGKTRYTPVAGMPELRRAIAKYLELLFDREINWEGVVVGSGAKQSLFNAVFTLFGPGDDVLIATPYWTSYPQIVSLARANPIAVSGNPDHNFILTPEDLESSYTDRVKGLILCSPCNPTGAVYSKDELQAVTEWAKSRGVCILSDEIYREVYFGDDRVSAPSILELPEHCLGQHLLIDGASKRFAMTGWRIGFTYSDVEIAQKLAALQSQTTSNAATPSQVAALRAFGDPLLSGEAVKDMVKAFRRRRDLVVELMGDLLPELFFVEPKGAFYFFIRVDSLFSGKILGSADFCSWILEETGVAMVPGLAFGDDRYVRISFATSDELLQEAIERVATAIQK